MATNLTSENNRSEGRRSRAAERYGLTGPIILVALGVLFLMGQFFPEWGVGRTWPVLLIVIGLAKLFQSVSAGRSTRQD